MQGQAGAPEHPVFIVRAAICFAVWNGLVFHAERPLEETGRNGRPSISLCACSVSAAVAGCRSPSARPSPVRLGESRDPHWFSTIYVALVIVGMLASARWRCRSILLTWLVSRKPMSDALTDLPNDLANLMFAFTVLWAHVPSRST